MVERFLVLAKTRIANKSNATWQPHTIQRWFSIRSEADVFAESLGHEAEPLICNVVARVLPPKKQTRVVEGTSDE